jgi:rhamnosyltransferase
MPGRCNPPGRTAVAAVVTAFEPDNRLISVCASVRHQVDLVVVVDDGSPAANERVLESCRDLGVVVVRHELNRGIGAALNTGVQAVRAHARGGAGADILTLDQDSVLPAGYVNALTAAAAQARAAGVLVAMVGPEGASGVRSAAARGDGPVTYSREPIQSGLLVPATTFAEIGLFDEDLFIDGVDSEFYLRARAHELRAIVARGAMLEHRLGRRHAVAIARRQFEVVHAAEFRYYYIGRNRVVLCRRYWLSEPMWVVTSVARDVRHVTVVTLFVPGRRKRLQELRRGLHDGMRGVVGPRPT